jgi:hypothetical protein
MTQDLKDLCLIDKHALAAVFTAAHNLLSHETDFIGKALAQDLSGMRLVQDWQPIETAPKGMAIEILLYQAGWSKTGIAHGYWDGWCWQICWDAPNVHLNPTHWMPLPEVPEHMLWRLLEDLAAPGLETEEPKA